MQFFNSYGETIPHSIEDVCVRRGEDVELDLQLVTNRFKCSGRWTISVLVPAEPLGRLLPQLNVLVAAQCGFVQ